MKKITIENFRCFREEQKADLAPLTLLVGENSTGKTSFMALIRILWDVAFLQMIPDFKEDPYDLGSFDEVVHHRGAKGGRAEQFKAGFDFGTKIVRNKGLPNQGLAAGLANRGTLLEHRLEVTFGKKGTVPTPVSMTLSDGETNLEMNWGDEEQPLLRLEISAGKDELNTKVRKIHFEAGRDLLAYIGSEPGLLTYLTRLLFMERRRKPSKTRDSLTVQEWQEISLFISRFERYYGSIKGRPYASAPVRSRPYRTYDIARAMRDSEGEHIPMYLSGMHSQGGKEWEYLKSALEKFGVAAGLFDEISVRPLGKKEGDPFQLQVRKFSGRLKGPHRNLIDVGYGVSQVLPVITELLRRDAPEMFLMQQPEVHLHPCAQAALGSLFCEVARPDRQLIVETHSDYILDRVRRDIRDGNSELKPEDVSILFFERRGLDVLIHSIRLDKEGQVVGAPNSYRKFFIRETNKMLKLD